MSTASITGELGDHTNEILWYRYELMGKKPLEMPSMSKYHDSYLAYDEQCVEYGYSAIESFWQEFVKDAEGARKHTFDDINALVFS